MRYDMEDHLIIINVYHVEASVCIVVDEVHANIKNDWFLIHSFQKNVSVIDLPEEWNKWVCNENEYEY